MKDILSALSAKLKDWAETDLSKQDPKGDEIRQLKNQRDGLLRIVRQFAGDQLPDMFVQTVGDLELAIKIADIEKRRGDHQFARANGLEAQLKAVSHPDAKPGEPLEVTRRRLAHVAANTFGEWIRFVKEQTDYLKGHHNFPTDADVVHSSLLNRMLNGEKPLAVEEYNAKFKK